MTASNIFAHSQLDTRSNPNLFMNGDFSLWQRGTTHTGITGAYTADRFIVGNNAGSLDVALGYGYEVGVQTNGMNLNQTNGNNVRVNQRVESNTFRSLSSNSVTISFWIHSNVGGIPIDWLPRSPVVQDVWSSVTDLGTISMGTTTANTWTFHTATLDVNMASVRNGFGGNIQLTGTHTASTTLSRMKLEFGDTATPFEPEHPSITLINCQRYYCRNEMSYANTLYAHPLYSANQYTTLEVQWPVRMRLAPVVGYGVSGFGGASPAFHLPTVDGLFLQWNISGNTYGGITGLFADAEL